MRRQEIKSDCIFLSCKDDGLGSEDEDQDVPERKNTIGARKAGIGKGVKEAKPRI